MQETTWIISYFLSNFKSVSNNYNFSMDSELFNASFLIFRHSSWRMLKRSLRMEDAGDMQWELVLVLILAWILCFLCIIKGIKSSGKVGWYFNSNIFLNFLIWYSDVFFSWGCYWFSYILTWWIAFLEAKMHLFQCTIKTMKLVYHFFTYIIFTS